MSSEKYSSTKKGRSLEVSGSSSEKYQYPQRRDDDSYNSMISEEESKASGKTPPRPILKDSSAGRMRGERSIRIDEGQNATHSIGRRSEDDYDLEEDSGMRPQDRSMTEFQKAMVRQSQREREQELQNRISGARAQRAQARREEGDQRNLQRRLDNDYPPGYDNFEEIERRIEKLERELSENKSKKTDAQSLDTNYQRYVKGLVEKADSRQSASFFKNKKESKRRSEESRKRREEEDDVEVEVEEEEDEEDQEEQEQEQDDEEEREEEESRIRIKKPVRKEKREEQPKKKKSKLSQEETSLIREIRALRNENGELKQEIGRIKTQLEESMAREKERTIIMKKESREDSPDWRAISKEDEKKFEKEIEILKMIDRIKRKVRKSIAKKLQEGRLAHQKEVRDAVEDEKNRRTMTAKPGKTSQRLSDKTKIYARDYSGKRTAGKHREENAFLLYKGLPTSYNP